MISAVLLIGAPSCKGSPAPVAHALVAHTLNGKPYKEATVQDLRSAVASAGWSVGSQAQAKALGTMNVNASKEDLVAMVSLIGGPSADYAGPRPSPPDIQEKNFRETGRAVYRDGEFVLVVDVHTTIAADKLRDVEQKLLDELR